jgi:hypothetical protein
MWKKETGGGISNSSKTSGVKAKQGILADALFV